MITERHDDGSVTHWLTLPIGGVPVVISTSQLAGLLIQECSEEALQSLIEMLCDG